MTVENSGGLKRIGFSSNLPTPSLDIAGLASQSNTNSADIDTLEAQVAAGSLVQKYVREFDAIDWTDGDTLVIPSTLHGRGIEPIVTDPITDASPTGYSVDIDVDGDVTLSVDAGQAFAGKVRII